MDRTTAIEAPPPVKSNTTLEDLALRDDYALNPQYVGMVVDAADRGDSARLGELIGALHPADVADLMGFLSADYRAEVIPVLRPEHLADILSELEDNLREEVLEQVPAATLAQHLADLDSDDAADVFDDLEEDKRDAVLAAMSDVDRAAIETTLGYEDESAGRLMQREVLAAPEFWTVGQTIDHIQAASEELPDLFFDVYVVDPAFKPVGALPVSRLLKASRDATLAGVMEPVTEITVDQDQEEVAYIFDKYHLISAPVTDLGGRLVGQITVDDIVGVIQEESQEDILALAGVADLGRDAGVLGVSKSRIPWLAVNLGTAMLGAGVISFFQGSIEKIVALAVLNPIVSAIGGNAGTQALTVTVRALATRELNAANAWRNFWREMAVGLLNGLALAPLIGIAAGLWFKDYRLGLVIAAAMVLNLLVAAAIGVLTPLTLAKLKFDPAVSSAVFVTATTDFFGFLIFLGLATIVLL